MDTNGDKFRSGGSGRSTADGRGSLGEVEEALGDINAAINAFSQALKKGVGHEATYTALIDLLRAAGREEEARAWRERRAAAVDRTRIQAD